MTHSLPNLNNPPLPIFHSALARFDEESAYKSCCPSCGIGVLLVARDNKTLKLIRRDRCVHCGQVFVYQDDSINGEKLVGDRWNEPSAEQIAQGNHWGAPGVFGHVTNNSWCVFCGAGGGPPGPERCWARDQKDGHWLPPSERTPYP